MSQAPNKSLQKMCKSPKNSTFQIKQDKIEYDMSTNCTVVGSNNLNLVKKPQLMTNMSPAYSHPSPNYPQSPYSSPAGLKSPSPSLKPPTPQPNFPVMQIFHNNLITRPIQNSQPQNIIKLKPHLNILPKPSASPQPSPKPSVSPQIVIPSVSQPGPAAAAALMQTPQPLLLNQMPMIGAPGVQFILRPQTAGHMGTAGTKLQTSHAPQGLILQPACGTQQLLQLGAPARSQPMVRVLTNGMQLAPSSTTYVTTQMVNQPINATHIQQTIVNNAQQQQQQHIQIQQQVVKKKPRIKVKKKLDLANIMKLSGIGDEDDIQFESDTSQSESEHNSVPTTPQPPSHPHPVTPTSLHGPPTFVQTENKKNSMHNIQISAMPQPTINAAAPVVQVLNQNFPSGMISNSTSQAAAAAAAAAAQSGGLPFNSTFITPNFTINNGLMLQRSGGFKLTVGEDGRLVLQHDPTINQDLQSQLILQSLLGLNGGGLVLQPSIDQQTVQQTVQTIQQQSVQTIQQQTVQSQTIQTVQQQTVQPQVQHTIQSLQPQIQQQTVQQTIQHQTVNALQQPMQIVQPQPIHSLHSQVQPTVHSISQSQVHNLQSQIQSLLQQQNVVQAQTVHQNVPHSVHSQAIQSVQNLTQNVQNLTQNLSQSSVQNVVAQNLSQSSVVAQNLAQQSSVQNVVSQNMAQSASVVAQNISQGVQSMQNVSSAQAQPMQSSVHSVQGFQQAHTQTTQPILKVQPFQKSQPPVQSVQPIQHQQHNMHDNHHNQLGSNTNNSSPSSYVVNLTPEQLEQLKRNGQVTVNGQTIFMQRPNKDQNEKKMSPKSKPLKKVSEIQKIQSIKSMIHENQHINDNMDRKPVINHIEQIKMSPPQNVKPLSSPVATQPAKHILSHSHVQTKPQQPQAMVQPSVQQHVKMERQKSPITAPKQQKVSPTVHSLNDTNGANTSHDVDKLLGQILEETHNPHSGNGNVNDRQPQQRITTIQLTPQKQQHLKTIQMQIQTLSARLQPGDTEVHNALKVLFAEQQKILASGKLLPPDKVYYLNNQLTIVNPSSLNLPSPASSIKSEPSSPVLSTSHPNITRSTSTDTSPASVHQPITTISHTSPRVSVSVATSTDIPTQSTVHHHPNVSHHHQTNNHHHPTVNQPSHVIVSHPNHVVNQRLNAIAQVPQLPPLYPKQPQLHSPQLHSPQLPSPKHLSPQISSPQMPSPQPQQLHSIATSVANSQPHGLVGISHHMQHNQQNQAAVNPQVIRAKQPITNAQLKTHNAINQHSSVQMHPTFQQQPNMQLQMHQHILNQQHAAQQKQAQSSEIPQLTMTKKAQLIEQQLAMDQQGASKPDVHRPFRDKRDACARLIRYHVFDQAVLSQQDLDKADEIFELTARHFIAKFDKMTDKYKYLLMKESMRQVQTSELMMLDRMFMSDEQQSLLRLRQDYDAEILNLASQPAGSSGANGGTGQTDRNQVHTNAQGNEGEGEEYDEWACIQRELGCLPESKEGNNPNTPHPYNNHHNHQSVSSLQNQHNSLKRTSSSDSRLETLKRFRVDKHTKKPDINSVQCSNFVTSSPANSTGQPKCGYESNTSSQANSSYGSCKEEESENNSIDEQVQSAINSILNLQQSTHAQLQQQNNLDLDSILS